MPKVTRTTARTGNHPPDRTIRLSVDVEPLLHAKLRALSSLRGVDASILAAGFIREGLRGMVIQERGGDVAGSDDDEGRAAPKIANL